MVCATALPLVLGRRKLAAVTRLREDIDPTATTWLRLALLAALSGCAPVIAEVSRGTDGTDTTDDTDDPSLPCGADEVDVLTSESDYHGPDRYLVCAPMPAIGACPPAGDTWALLYEGVSPPQDPEFCSWLFDEDCGPIDLEPNACCYVAHAEIICEGRPLRTDDGLRTAPLVPGSWAAPLDGVALRPDDAAARATWERIARAEHASIASFARFVLELCALGAPPDLLADATAAQADEIRHASQALSVLHAITGESLAPGPLSLDGIELRADPAAILRGTILEGCLNETLAAAEAARLADAAPDPALAAVYRTIARDEAGHAALAWRAVSFILDRHPDLRPLARDLLTGALAPAHDRDGTPDHAVLREVVRPVAEAVIGPLHDRCAA